MSGQRLFRNQEPVVQSDRERFKLTRNKTTTATAIGTSLNKRFNEQYNGCARAL